MSVPDEEIDFPHPSLQKHDDIIAVGGELSVRLLKKAYQKGIFPWPHEGYPMLWFYPKNRGVIKKENFKVSKRLLRYMRAFQYQFTWSQKFEDVIRGCQGQLRPGQNGTWITEEILQSYVSFHKAGFGQSLEVSDPITGKLVGGIYGVLCDGFFGAESMFFVEDNASKMALYMLCEFLFFMNFDFIDVQMLTETSQQFGAELISKKEFGKIFEQQKKKLNNAHLTQSDFSNFLKSDRISQLILPKILKS